MTDNKSPDLKSVPSPNLKLVDFNKAKVEAEKPPKFLLDKLELLNTKAQEGKLKIAIVHFDYENDEGDMEGGTMLWHCNHNALEILGLAEVVKAGALQFTFEQMHQEDGDDDTDPSR